MAQVTIDNETLPEGTEVEIPGLGVFKNGQTVEVPEERVLQAKKMGYDYFAEDNTLKIVVEGPTTEPTAPSAASTESAEAAEKSDAALEEQMRIQKERNEDSTATANIGIEVESEDA